MLNHCVQILNCLDMFLMTVWISIIACEQSFEINSIYYSLRLIKTRFSTVSYYFVHARFSSTANMFDA